MHKKINTSVKNYAFNYKLQITVMVKTLQQDFLITKSLLTNLMKSNTKTQKQSQKRKFLPQQIKIHDFKMTLQNTPNDNATLTLQPNESSLHTSCALSVNTVHYETHNTECSDIQKYKALQHPQLHSRKETSGI